VIDFSRNHFELFGLPARFRFDPAVLDRAWRELQREIHPDRYATAGETERRLALQSSARVNEAYRELKDPVARAQYLLSLHGIDVFHEADTVLPAEFLEQQIERRHLAGEAYETRDARVLSALLEEVRADIAEEERRLAVLLDVEGAWEAARARVRELRFLVRLGTDVDAMLGALED
jgi:molecular chaperone HscB